MKLLQSVLVLILGFLAHETHTAMTEDELRDFLKNIYEQSASAVCTKEVEAEWNFETDVNNKAKEEYLVNMTLEAATFDKDNWEHHFKNLNPDHYHDKSLKRTLSFMGVLGHYALDQKKLAELTTTINTMTNIYSTAKICPYDTPNCDLAITEGLTLEDIVDDMDESDDYDELLYLWKAWSDASGAKIKNLYPEYVNLSNEAAAANNFSDKGELWRSDYEDSSFVEDIDAIWNEVEPLYIELHTYVGNKLKELYGDKLDFTDGLLPAHIFGDVWAVDWISLSELVQPYPNASSVDVDAALKEQNYTVLDMFETADVFYQSMGLLPNDISYNTTAGAMIEKPIDGREVVCHSSAWDFCDGKNYKIKMCTEVTFDYFTIIHHEMGHIQYYLQYAKQPIIFRDGANPGFHEAIGDTIALSASTPRHLKTIDLLPDYEDSEEASINFLMDMALEKVTCLPSSLLVDKWRWDVFAGVVPEDEWNSHWWKYSAKYQRVKPPVPRSDKTDFDPGAIYHVASDWYYIAYFVADILQFQFYKSLCIAAGQYDPKNPELQLHKCDFYRSVAAGDKLKAGLQLGSSVHWKDVLEVMTGERQMSAGPFLEYFAPLYEFLKKENAKHKIIVSQA